MQEEYAVSRFTLEIEDSEGDKLLIDSSELSDHTWNYIFEDIDAYIAELEGN